MHALMLLGWSPFFEQQWNQEDREGLVPARLIEEQRGSYRILGETGPWYAEVAGRLRHEMEWRGELRPCVGDWVAASVPAGEPGLGGVARIHGVLPRRSRFSRQDAGRKTREQVVAANVDTVFLVQSLNRDLNPRRLERYLALLWESGAEPVLLLSKADLVENPAGAIESVEESAVGVPILVTSALTSGGLDPLRTYLKPGRTVALVGSSGVGKSTIVNRLLGEDLLTVAEIRSDGRGRHTTTARRLVLLSGGGMLLDTPGMRTVLMWEGEEGLSRTFEDVEAVAARCRFRDCAHGSEPGCAVRDALASGALDPARYQSYDKLRREARYQARRVDVRLRIAEQRKWRRIHLEYRRRENKKR